MPLTIPAFSQYNAPMPPLRGLWHARPAEGDFFVSAEIDWLISPPANAVQFSLSGNSPVALSQIVALVADNGRCGADVSFLFPDTGFELVVAARNQGVFPVFTNALMFYAISPGAIQGDTTILQIMNSMPPPIPIVASVAQNSASVTGIAPQTNGITQIIPASVSGTLNSFQLTGNLTAGASAGSAQFNLLDGTSRVLWTNIYSVAANGNITVAINPQGLALRFQHGLQFQIVNSTLAGFELVFNAYYSTP
jgi:hypothetical protein